MAKQVFLTDILVEVFDTKSAILDVDFLLLSISEIVKRALAFLRRVVAHGDVVRGLGREGATVDAVCGRRQGCGD